MEVYVVGTAISVVFGIIQWLIKRKLESVSTLEKKVNTLETKMELLGDIQTMLLDMKMDLAVIKAMHGYTPSTQGKPA